jgi:putative hydrolase of the HAD superfamily
LTKAVFLDYTGTITREDSPDVTRMLDRLCRNSDCKDGKKLAQACWRFVRAREAGSCGADFMTEDEIVDRMLSRLEKKFRLRDDRTELHALFQNHWKYAQIFDDVKEFFEKCPVPVYLVTNNGAQYVRVAMQRNGLHPAAIVCGDMVKAYKPRREIFQKALEVSGVSASSAVHVGDSVSSDVKGALSAGIRPVLLNRTGADVPVGVESVSRLPDVLPLL